MTKQTRTVWTTSDASNLTLLTQLAPGQWNAPIFELTASTLKELALACLDALGTVPVAADWTEDALQRLNRIPVK